MKNRGTHFSGSKNRFFFFFVVVSTIAEEPTWGSLGLYSMLAEACTTEGIDVIRPEPLRAAFI